MNDNERMMLEYVCKGDIRQAQQYAQVFLNNVNAKKDERFKEHMLKMLEAKKPNTIELPYNLRELLVAEDVSNFPIERFLLRKEEDEIVKQVLNLYEVSNTLAMMNISYLPALMLHGKSGCGKTMLARYIAYKANLPFVYVRFSSLVNQYLGGTQTNIGKVFEYARTSPCVLCFDEIDAVGMARGQKNDVGEMNRIVIALMQEMDMLPNNVIIIGTTNRFDRLDDALVRRFPLQLKVKELEPYEASTLAKKFFAHAGLTEKDYMEFIPSKDLLKDSDVPASSVIQYCTNIIVQYLLSKQINNIKEK